MKKSSNISCGTGDTSRQRARADEDTHPTPFYQTSQEIANVNLRIVHFSKTPLAGGPYRLVRLLQKHTNYNVRLVDLERWGQYPHDVVHSETPEETLDLVEKADIIHFHNYLDYNSKDFVSVDFNSLRQKGTAFVRQFRSEPNLVANVMGISVSELLASPIPSIVIAQYPERFYPAARVVPNAIPTEDPEYCPTFEELSTDILFSPTKSISAWQERWNTKGAPETIEIMQQVARLTGCTTKVISGRPLAEVLSEKRKAQIILDDLVTGSYHISGVEAMCLGKAVLSYLDSRTELLLQELTGSKICPFINVRLEDAREVLMYLLKHPEEAVSIGKAGREWIDLYWCERMIVQHYVDVYEKLLCDPALVCRQDALRLDTPKAHFTAIILPDIVYEARTKRAHGSVPIWRRIGKKLQQHLSRLSQRIRDAILRRLPIEFAYKL
ncbi:MAG: hypothetical protein SAK29_36950 [Scytonema sp. PMC 1069.18]|nr:hypothetical protein [Scytonema sp. PMC 1069.18]MEC4888258.1 hypothetical protein [Scytonema sp. PMC 1070.18]